VSLNASASSPADGAGMQLAWDAPGLQRRLSASVGAVTVRAVAQTGSTNTDLMKTVRELPAQHRMPQVLLAETQTGGRGRIGRAWMSQAGASLTFSLAWPLRPLQGWGALSLAVGHALAQALQPWPQGQPPPGQGRLMLKWPNDLLWFDSWPLAQPDSPGTGAALGGRKVAGILIETVPLSASALAKDAVGPSAATRWVVVGVGVNVRAQDVASEGLPPQGLAGTSLWRAQDEAPALWHLAAEAVARALVDFEDQGFGPIHSAVQSREALIGQSVTLSAGPVAQGQCVGIDENGALLVQALGGVYRVVAGDVQVRPAASGFTDTPHP